MPAVIEKESIGQALSSVNGTESLSSQKKFLNIIENSASTIIDHQHPITGFFPAATRARHVAADGYHRSWARDGALTTIGEAELVRLKIFPAGSETEKKVIKSAVGFMEGILDLSMQEPWRSAFEQESNEVKDQEGHVIYRELTKEAPPIHFEPDGRPVFWWRQNQPDSWGAYLISLGSGLKQGFLALNPKQQESAEVITNFLLRNEIKNLKQSSMWEGCEVYSPAPLSSVAIVAKGLGEIQPFVSARLKGKIDNTILSSKRFIRNNYPKEYTVPDGHLGETDLATLVAHDLGALEGFSLSQYFRKSDRELGNGKDPGNKRFMGDIYYGVVGKEAIWPLGALLEAKILLEKAINSFKSEDNEMGKRLQSKGVSRLKKVIDLQEKYGYLPELLEQRGGELTPNGNDLLWNHAQLIKACAFALVSERFSPISLN
ncbi:MAG: hypothetical protein HW400_898 [Candidatus Levybacteria bacterium]|nr:hypothetical protein [Candidatus Levybacteria bacterium]